MAYGNLIFFSKSLVRSVDLKVVVPTDVDSGDNDNFKRPMKLLILLHGYTGSCGDWLLNAKVVELANQYNLCVAMPSGENSFYLDGPETGRKYGTFVGEEIPAFLRKTFNISDKKEDLFIGGFSMGGFGALHVGIKFADNFGGLFAFSSALIVHGIAGMKDGEDNGVANTEYYKLMFGDLDKVEESDNNPEELIKQRKIAGKEMPKIYMACGTEDFLLEPNRLFKKFLQDNEVEFEYVEDSGVHDFNFWARFLEPATKYLLEQ